MIDEEGFEIYDPPVTTADKVLLITGLIIAALAILAIIFLPGIIANVKQEEQIQLYAQNETIPEDNAGVRNYVILDKEMVGLKDRTILYITYDKNGGTIEAVGFETYAKAKIGEEIREVAIPITAADYRVPIICSVLLIAMLLFFAAIPIIAHIC